MSSVEKMSIQGIRSFSPEAEQRITFFSPLTLILGPNGTGKTTVIECLKYMTTGDMPPGSKGGAFIHDPKIAHEREVKGQIRLMIKDITGQHMTVQRLVTATQKAKRIEMRTLEGVITRRGPDGSKQSVSQRCADIDKEMVTALGVSKAVLENVIFCHQEDSNWPLSEGKPLKEKFDAIFASTRYTKVLETIRKLKIEQDGKVKIFREEIKYLKQHKDKASQLEAELEELQVKMTVAQDSVEDISQKLQPIQTRLEQICSSSNEIYEMKTKIEKVTKEKELVEINITELRDNIENEFQGTTPELERAIRDFEEKVEERLEKLEQLEAKQRQLSAVLDKIGREKSKLLVEVGGLRQEATTNEENIRKKDGFVRRYAQELGFEGFDHGAITETKCESFFQLLESKVEGMKADAEEAKVQHEAQEAELQRKMDDLKASKTRLQQSQTLKQEAMVRNKAEIEDISKQLAHLEKSASRLAKLATELKQAEAALRSAESSVNLDSLKSEIAQLDRQRKDLDVQVKTLSAESDRLHRQSGAQAQLKFLKKDRDEKEETIGRLKTKHKDSLIMLLGHLPGQDMRSKVEEYISSQSELVRKGTEELQRAKTELSTREAERIMIKKELDQKEAELKRLEDRVFEVCGSQNVEEGLATVQEKLTKAQDDRGFLMGGEHFYKKYVADLRKTEPCCPLCHRGFQQEQEVRELVLELDQKLRLVPNRLRTVEKEMDELERNKNNLIELRPLQENITKLQDTVIPELKNKMKRKNNEIAKLRETVSKGDDDLTAKESDEAVAKAMHSDVVMMDRYLGEVRQLERKIATQEETLNREDCSRSVEEVIQDKEDKQLVLDTVNTQLEHHRTRLSEQSDRLQRLQGEVTSLREEKASIANELAQQSRLEESRASLTTETRLAEKDIKEAKAQLKPLEDKIVKVEREKQTVARRKEKAWEEDKLEMENVKGKGIRIKNLNLDIKQYAQTGKGERLEKSQARVQELGKQEEKEEEEGAEIARNMDQLKEDLSKQQVQQRELSDCLQLRRKEGDITRLDTELSKLQEKLGEMDVGNLAREQNRLRNERDRLQNEHSDKKGRLHSLQGQISGVKKELGTDLYAEAAKKHRVKMIEMRTTEIANHDLEKYYRAMDKAIMNYHTQKMEEINKIIRDLWRSTYQGHDIETIEIRSDEDEGGINKVRRNYNYRVVMIQGDAALDMRGRCSAGQKVLASLIIRLALAETFCINCGVLALDEPTTNLDRENIEGLASALVEIIKNRSQQKNFQLLIITHDEDFVELLGRSDYVEYFYRVGKCPNGYSELTRVPVRDLHR